ncbi:hypothetical protein HYH03_006938 [Edaphochlamys debaryana]|uniref:Uncharacterized protein n=1 Tax=Edaphochlamys debaryana TaxID=47281 RepID=A0A835Y9U3_9CHLO|nr:hypothetical protein HYH03_006938 [Edaphochlamys debaryana]|eukprot:KAG2495005.1 hypothetical protein HYH03_006938 [Edaphochlamys debaryana]
MDQGVVVRPAAARAPAPVTATAPSSTAASAPGPAAQGPPARCPLTRLSRLTLALGLGIMATVALALSLTVLCAVVPYGKLRCVLIFGDTSAAKAVVRPALPVLYGPETRRALCCGSGPVAELLLVLYGMCTAVVKWWDEPDVSRPRASATLESLPRLRLAEPRASQLPRRSTPAMPRPRTQRPPEPPGPPPPPAEGVPASDSEEDEEEDLPPLAAPLGGAPPPPAPRDPQMAAQQEQFMRNMPDSLPRELKLAALGWRGGCFCCPARISFGQCLASMWHASRKPNRDSESLVHWGLNATKLLTEAANSGAPGPGRALMLSAGFLDLAPQLLGWSDEVPQGIMLTPQMHFVQVFATGTKQVPLSTTPTLVTLGLMSQITGGGGPGLAAAVSSRKLPPALVACVGQSGTVADDRVRSMTLQLLADWVSASAGEADAEAAEEEEEAGTGVATNGASAPSDASAEARDGGGAASSSGRASPHAGFVSRLLSADLPGALATTFRHSLSVPVLRDGAMLIITLLAAGGSARAAGGGLAKPKPAAGCGDMPWAQGGRQGGWWRRLMAPVLTEGTVLAGAEQCRAREELLKAGVVPAILACLSRAPTELRYWLPVNIGVSGAQLLEAQRLLMVALRALLLPEAPASPSDGSTGAGAAEGGSGGGSAEEVAALRRAAGEDVLKSTAFLAWSQTPGGKAALAEGPAAGAGAGKAEAGKAHGAEEDDEDSEEDSEEEEEEEADWPPGPSPEAKAARLVSTALAAAGTVDVVLPAGVPLAVLPPTLRNATPDWRLAQRERIRKATEEARAAAAQASAAAAVDVLSKAVANL